MQSDAAGVDAHLPLHPFTFHILLSLAAEERHGYGIIQDVARRTDGDVRLSAGALYRTTGPAFSANPWNGGAVVATEAGTATLAFADADTGTFTYTYAGVRQSKPITRQAFATPATVCRN